MQQSEAALGTAKLGKLMLKFAIPCVLSLLVSALYNIVDQIFIGNSELGDLGNAATGAVFPVFVIAQAFAWWFGDGCAAYLNIRQGRNDADRAHRALGTGITLTVAASALLLVVFYPLRRPALLLFGASENSIGYAVEYFNIILGFFPVFMASNMINSLVRADGSPAWAMASMLSGAIVNIVLDAVFIFALRLGMAGAAWATGIGQAVSFAVCLYYLLRRTKTFKLRAKSFVPELREFGNAARLGISSFITQFTIVIIATVGNIMLKKYGGASVYGEDIPIAIMAVESKVFTVVINLIVGIVLGCQPIIGYNVGAKNRARVKRLYLYILLCTLVIGAVATLVFELAPLAVVGMFGAPKFSYYRERIVRNRADFMWRGRVHEAIAIHGNIIKAKPIILHAKPTGRASGTRNLDIYRKMAAEGHVFEPRETYYYARELYYNGEHDGAAREFERYLGMRAGYAANDIDACLMLSRCYAKLGDKRKSFAALFDSFEYALPTGEVCCEIAFKLFADGDYKRAAYWFKRAAQAKPDIDSGAFIDYDCYGFLPYIWLSVCYDKLGNRRTAYYWHRRARKVNPNHPSVIANQAYFESIGF